MFTLPIFPNFPGLRRRLLAMRSVPELPLAGDLETAIHRISKPDESGLGQLRQGLRGNGGKETTGPLWGAVFASVRRLVMRASFFSLIAAACAAGATLVGMEILKVVHGAAVLVGFASAFFLMNVVSHIVMLRSDRLRLFVSLTVESHLVGLISAKLLRISPRARIRHSTGNLKVLVTSDARNVGAFLDNVVRNLIPSLMALIVIAPILVHLAGWAGLAGIVIMAVILPVSAGLNRISMRYQERTQTEMDALATLAGEWVKNIRLIRFLSWNRRFEADIAHRVQRFTRVASLQHLMACLIFGLSVSWWMVSVAGVALVSLIGGFQVEVVPFFGAIWLLNYLSNYFTHLPNTIRLYGIAVPSIRRIARLLAEEERSESFAPGPEGLDLTDRRPIRIRFDRVRFSYGTEVLREVSVTLEMAEKTAILGEIGSGKTTLLRLLCGELPPSAGSVQVEFDGGDRHDLWIEPVYERVRSTLAYVPQQPFVSNDTLASNVALEDGPDDHRVMDAIARAELEADVALLAGGLAEEIGENGVNLSGGQKQRLNLARAFHSGREYLVLDDPLSAVDPRTERLLMEQLSRRGAGMLLVTHRVGELMRMERVLVMKDGRIVEDGRPAELAARPDSHFTRVLRAYESQEAHSPEAAAVVGAEEAVRE